MARFVPGDADELVALLRERPDESPPLLPTGGGRRAGGDVSAETGPVDVLSTAGLRGVHALRPRDLTVTVGAGTRVADLRDTLREEGLWLAISGTGLDRSVGGLVAAAAWDPLDAARGDLRRQLLACETVTWAGEPARWGRAVLKDVAGYGMTRAVAGSWGTLGVVHAATFRLWPAPEADRLVTLRPADGDHVALAGRTAVSALDADVRPDAATWRWRAGEDDGEAVVEVRLLGSEHSVELREERLRRWAGEHGAEAGSSRPTAGAGGPLRGDADGRDRGVSRVALTPGRRALGDTVGSLVHDLPDLVLRAEADLLGGRVRCRYRRDGGASLRRLLDAVGDAPVRVERGSAEEIAAAAARRPENVVRLEARVRDALSGRPRHWLADYV